MMKYLFYSEKGDSLGLALKVKAEGNEVSFYCKSRKDNGAGIIKKASIGQDYSSYDIVVFDSPEGDSGTEIELLRKRGIKVIGGSSLKIPIDTGVLGFNTYKTAINFIKEEKGRYIMNLNGRKYIGSFDDGSDCINLLECCEKYYPGMMKGEAILLTKYIDGIKVSISSWCDGNKIIYPPSIIFNEGDMGALVFFTNRFEKLWDFLLKSLKNIRGVVGKITLDFIMEKDSGKLFLLSNHIGCLNFPAIYAENELIKDEWGKILNDLAQGSLKRIRTKNEDGIVASYLKSENPNLPVSGINKDTFKFVKFVDVKYEDNKFLNTADRVCYITAHGKNIKLAQRELYRRCSMIAIPDGFYATNIGDRCKNDIPRLKIYRVI